MRSRRVHVFRTLLAVVAVTVFVAGCSSSTGERGGDGVESAMGSGGLLYVQRAASGRITRDAEGMILELEGLDPTTTWFTDRPARRAGVMASQEFLDGWPREFGGVDPNAIVSPDAVGSTEVTVSLHPIRSDSGSVVYRIVPLDGSVDLPTDLGRLGLFIDDGGSSGQPVQFTISNLGPGQRVTISRGTPGLVFSEAPFGSPTVRILGQDTEIPLDEFELDDSSLTLMSGSSPEGGTVGTVIVAVYVLDPGAGAMSLTAEFDPSISLMVEVGNGPPMQMVPGLAAYPIG